MFKEEYKREGELEDGNGLRGIGECASMLARKASASSAVIMEVE